MSLFYPIIFGVFCYDQWQVYDYVSKQHRGDADIRSIERKNAYILSIRSSLILLLMGIYANYLFAKSGFDTAVYFENITVHQDFLFKLALTYFTSYLVMDCVMGTLHYPRYMTSLSGYFHHIVYIILNGVAWKYRLYPHFLLFMLAELPTQILSIGQYNPRYRNDNLFGFTFLATRIVYHIILLTQLTNYPLVFILGLLILPLHVFWFRGWITKYFRKNKTQ